MNNTCTFTGHRNIKDFDQALLDRVIENLIKNGCRRFYNGMARGFDLAAAESVLSFKKIYPDIELIACIPCPEQSQTFSAVDRERYKRALSGCSEKILLSDKYYSGCMFYRNRFMVDNADVIVSYLRKKFGGTYYTVRYAEKCGKKVIEL